jgi:hypothetical protein
MRVDIPPVADVAFVLVLPTPRILQSPPVTSERQIEYCHAEFVFFVRLRMRGYYYLYPGRG